MVVAAEAELRRTKEQIKIARRQTRQATTLAEQREIQERIKQLESQQRRQRQHIFTREDEIESKREELIGRLEARLAQKTHREVLFTVRWRVV
jgi:hypothetical protein